ncbi:MAG TPA: PAN domain-containing protein [Polyangiales bacterium]|nr:PAN domain-containing protein [Polyangiales bacterium]
MTEVELKARLRLVVVVTSLLSACAAEVSEPEDSVGVANLDEALTGGIIDRVNHPEVVQFTAGSGGQCTATMITRRYFVTAAHCVAYASRATGGTITFTALGGSPLPVQEVFAFAGSPTLWQTSSCSLPGNTNPYCSTGVGLADVALGRLAADAPAAGWTPARISSSGPAGTEVVNLWGYGCGVRPPANWDRRTFTSTYNTTGGVICPGDSGGPVFRADGTIGAIISGGNGTIDVFADLPSYKLRIQRMIRQLEGGLNPGIDLHAADIPGQAFVITPDARECRTTCQKNKACRAWTWLSGTNRCYQKDATADWSPRDGAVSGTIEPIDPFIWGGLDTPFDLPGSNLPGMPVSAPSVADCARQCWENSFLCRAYTYVSTTAKCWLKGSVPAPSTASSCVQSRTCVSGIRRFAGSRDYSYNDILGPYPSNELQCPIDCMSSPGCQAFTFWNGSCWLKAPAPPAGNIQNGLTSDVRSGFYYNSEILNLTPYKTIVLASGMSARPEPQACAAACSRESTRCQSWTMQTQNSTSSMDITCLLYDSVGFAYPRNGAVSGVRALQLW